MMFGVSKLFGFGLAIVIVLAVLFGGSTVSCATAVRGAAKIAQAAPGSSKQKRMRYQ